MSILETLRLPKQVLGDLCELDGFPALKRLSDEIRGINECDFSGIIQGDISMFARAAWFSEIILSKCRSKMLQNHVPVDVYRKATTIRFGC